MSLSAAVARISCFAAALTLTVSVATAQQTPSDSAKAPKVPFSHGDFTWMNGQSRQREFPLTLSPYVTASVYLDSYFAYSTNRPRDNTLVGSASLGRHNEFMINLAAAGITANYKNVLANITLQTGSMLNIVQDLDGTAARGRNLSTTNLHNIMQATAGYHFDKAYGLNVEAGIFLSYIGLESYLLAENWNYHRSLVCDYTPFYFQGLRIQYYPSRKLKIEPWLMNGFQTYGKFNSAPGVGTSVYYRPSERLGLITNFYYGTDTPNIPERKRFHNDHSVLFRYASNPDSRGISKAAFSINNHIGFQSGGGVQASDAYMLGTSIAHRLWFDRDRYAFSVRGEYLSNPTRYLSPPAAYSSQSDQTSLKIGGLTGTFDIMPTDFMTFRFEVISRRANVPYFAGREGTTTAENGFPSNKPFTVEGSKNQTLLTAAINFRL